MSPFTKKLAWEETLVGQQNPSVRRRRSRVDTAVFQIAEVILPRIVKVITYGVCRPAYRYAPGIIGQRWGDTLYRKESADLPEFIGRTRPSSSSGPIL